MTLLLLASLAAGWAHADQDDDKRARHAESVARAREVISQAQAAQAAQNRAGQHGQASNAAETTMNSQSRNNAAAPGATEEYQRAARLSQEERRTLRQQINEAGRVIYSNPPTKP